jgi:hypothetical protein
MGGPSAGRVFPGQEIKKALQFLPQVEGAFSKFTTGDPIFGPAQKFGQSLLGSMGWIPGVIGSQGALTQRQRADALSNARAVIAPSGNLRTSPSAVSQELNLSNLEQQRLQNAMGLAGAGVQTAIAPETAAAQVFSSFLSPLLGVTSSAGLENAQLQSQASIAQANKNAALESAGIKLVGDTTSAVLSKIPFSDVRLKKNIKDTGKTTGEGIPIKTFQYKDGTKQRYRGVMAQDVEKVHPEAVITMPITGHKMIDLRKVNVPFQRLQDGGPVAPRPPMPTIGPLPMLPMPTIEDILQLMGPDTPKKKKKPPDKKPQEKPDAKDWSANVAQGTGAKSTDTVPIMATPGEHVMNLGASTLFRPVLRLLNEIGRKHPIMMQGGGEVGSEPSRSRGLPPKFGNVSFMAQGGDVYSERRDPGQKYFFGQKFYGQTPTHNIFTPNPTNWTWQGPHFGWVPRAGFVPNPSHSAAWHLAHNPSPRHAFERIANLLEMDPGPGNFGGNIFGSGGLPDAANFPEGQVMITPGQSILGWPSTQGQIPSEIRVPFTN